MSNGCCTIHIKTQSAMSTDKNMHLHIDPCFDGSPTSRLLIWWIDSQRERFQQFQKTFIQSYPFLQTSTELVSFCYPYAFRHLKSPITFGLGCKTTYQNSRNGEIMTPLRRVKRVKFMRTWVQENDESDRLTACGKAAGVASNFLANWAK